MLWPISSVDLTSMSSLVSTDRIIPVDHKDGELVESILVPREVTEVVPTHRIDICLSNLFPKDRMVSGKETVELLVANERLVLNNLSINTGRPQGFYLRHEQVSDSFDSLKTF